HQVGQVGSSQAGSAAAQHGKIDIVAQRNLLGMHPQNGLAAPHVGAIHYHAAIKTAGAEQRRIENVGSVRSSHQDDAFVGFEAVHLNQQLVQGLLTLVVPAAQACATVAPH